jgi:hypothetical protein
MFETLLSRIRLRERLKLQSYIHVDLQVCQRYFFSSFDNPQYAVFTELVDRKIAVTGRANRVIQNLWTAS